MKPETDRQDARCPAVLDCGHAIHWGEICPECGCIGIPPKATHDGPWAAAIAALPPHLRERYPKTDADTPPFIRCRPAQLDAAQPSQDLGEAQGGASSEQLLSPPEQCVHCEESITVVHSLSMLERCYEGYMYHESAEDTFTAWETMSRQGAILADRARSLDILESRAYTSGYDRRETPPRVYMSVDMDAVYEALRPQATATPASGAPLSNDPPASTLQPSPVVAGLEQAYRLANKCLQAHDHHGDGVTQAECITFAIRALIDTPTKPEGEE